MRRRARALGLSALLCWTLACSSSTAPSAGGSQPATAAKSGGGGTTTVDINALFPPGPGRDLVLNNCTNCHSIAPIVLSQFDEGGWRNHRVQHSPRVPALSEADKDLLWSYLVKTFPPGRQLPQLPPEMLQGEAGY